MNLLSRRYGKNQPETVHIVCSSILFFMSELGWLEIQAQPRIGKPPENCFEQECIGMSVNKIYEMGGSYVAKYHISSFIYHIFY